MSYVRASTDNPFGWRPGTLQLGYMSSGRQNGPNWKDVAAQHDAAIRSHRNRQRGIEHAIMSRMHEVDAAARGDRSRVRIPRMSGLGLNAIDLNAQMARGAQYVFHFNKTGATLGSADMGALAATVAADSNFLNPVAAVEGNGFQVRFVYNGQGSVVGNAGAEMQKVINDRNANGIGVFASAVFSSAEGGPALSAAPPQGVTVFTTSPDGTIIQFSDGSVLDTTTGITVNADGSVRSASTSSPGGASGGAPGSSLDLNTLIGGIGIGGAVALGLGAVILLKSL